MKKLVGTVACQGDVAPCVLRPCLLRLFLLCYAQLSTVFFVPTDTSIIFSHSDSFSEFFVVSCFRCLGRAQTQPKTAKNNQKQPKTTKNNHTTTQPHNHTITQPHNHTTTEHTTTKHITTQQQHSNYTAAPQQHNNSTTTTQRQHNNNIPTVDRTS